MTSPPPRGGRVDESDCTSVFSTLQLHDVDQVNFQNFFSDKLQCINAILHGSPLPPATSYDSSYSKFPESRGFTVAG
jgi:hypothetical protein